MVKCERTYQGLLFVQSPFRPLPYVEETLRAYGLPKTEIPYLCADGGEIIFDAFGGTVDFAECVKARFSFETFEGRKK